MADGMRFAGRVFDGSGTAINAATINEYDVGTTTPVRLTTTSNVTGDWEIDGATRGLFDIEIVNGTTTRRIVQDTEVQFKSLWLWNADADEFAFGVTRTEAAASVEVAYFEGDRASPADNDLAYISLRLSDSAGNQDEQARIEWQATTVLNGATQDGDMVLYALVNNVLTEMVRLDGSANQMAFPTGTVFNFAAGDVTLTHSSNLITSAGGDWNFGAQIVYINDTANANMTTGLTINQGAADNQILDFKSSDVATGLTTLVGVETDDFTEFRKFVATTGGVQLRGLSSATRTIRLDGWAQTDTQTKTAAATGGIELVLNRHNGANAAGAFTADSNILIIGAEDSGGYFTRYIFDLEGSAHADVAWTTFDAYDDLALVHDIEQHLLARESEAGTYNRHALEAAGIIGRDSWHMENGKPRAMLNMTRLAMLHHGALIQIGQRFDERDGEIAALRAEIAELRRALPAA